MEHLVDFFSNEQVSWRFDPIVHWKENGELKNNLSDLEYLSGKIRETGVRRCVISFVQMYGKVKKRMESRSSFKFVDILDEEKKLLAKEIAKINKENSIDTFSCANTSIIDGKLIKKSHCIDGALLENIFKEKVSKAKDSGQREECGCTKSRDIGSYNQECFHGCLYCYANGI